MKTVKKILIGLGVFIAILLIAGLFMGHHMHVEREITIYKPKMDVFNYVKLLKSQDEFSYWNLSEPTMDKSYYGTDGTIGAYSSWKGEKMGIGEQEIKKIVEGERVEFELRFKKPMEQTNSAYFETSALNENTTLVKWAFEGEVDYPMNVMMPIMKLELGRQLQIGMDNLKSNLEK
jgi:hypothetical protein